MRRFKDYKTALNPLCRFIEGVVSSPSALQRLPFSLVTVRVADLLFEERFHLFGLESMAAEHAIVTHLTVKIQFTRMAFRAG